MPPGGGEPPLIASPRRSASAASRRSVASEWLGCRTSTPSRPSAWNCRIFPSLPRSPRRSEEHTSELQSQSNLVCRLLLEKKKNTKTSQPSHDPPHLCQQSALNYA